MDSANTQRKPVFANAAAERLMPPLFSTIVVVPVRMRFQRTDGDHQRRLFALQQAVGLNGELRGVGEAEVLVEPARERRRKMRVTVDEAGEQRLAAAVVDLGLRIGLQNLVGRADGRDSVALDRQRHVVAHGVHGHDGRLREDDGLSRWRLRLQAAAREGGRGTGSGAGEQLTPSEMVGRACHG